jgi:glutathione S-transferase
LRRLVTIPISHFCEKARWALDRAGLEFSEERHVQGIHMVAARRAGGGRTVPVLVAPEAVLAESEDILGYADDHLPAEQRLIPEETALRKEVLALSRWLDAGLGPDGRRLMYAHMMPMKELLLPVNNQGVPAWEDRLLTRLWPLAKSVVSRRLGIGERTISDDRLRVQATFDSVAARLADGRRHLCGDRFTAADLTFATLSAAILVPPEYGVRLPQPDELPGALAQDIRALREHPAGAYALELFRTRRHAGPLVPA